MTKDRDLRYRGESEAKKEELKHRVDFLKSIGFTDDKVSKTIATLSNRQKLKLWKSEKVRKSIDGFMQRGFSDPEVIIREFPDLLGLSFENIDAKIDNLRLLGFKDPNKYVRSNPRVLGLSIESLSKKKQLLDKLISLYGIPFSSIELIKVSMAYITSSKDKIIILARIVNTIGQEYKNLHDKPMVLRKYYLRTLMGTNLENTLVAMAARKKGEAITDFIKRVDQVKKRNLSVKEKRDAIFRSQAIPVKMKDRYLRGYPGVGLGDRMDQFREMGFEPRRLLRVKNNIMNYLPENVGQRLHFFENFIKQHNLSYVSAQEFMEQNPLSFSTSLDKVNKVFDIVRSRNVKPEELSRHIINRLLRANVDNLWAAAEQAGPDEDIGTVLYHADLKAKEKRTGEVKGGVIFDASDLAKKS